MTRGKRKIGMDVINQQIEEAQGEVIRAKRKSGLSEEEES